MLNFYFDKYEDGSLLKYITIERVGIEELSVDINGQIATASFLNTVSIKGTPNDGSDSNTDNYINLRITFNVTDSDVTFKNNDFKSLYIDIIKQ